MKLAKQLEHYLKTSGMPATELARRSGVSRKTIQNWMSGQNPKSFDQVKAVCEVIGCTLDTLIYGEGFKEKTDSQIFDDSSWMSGVFEIKVRRIK